MKQYNYYKKINININNQKQPYHKNLFSDLLKIPEKYFYEYSNQKKYFNDKEKLTLYYALSNSAKRRQVISQPNYYSIIALIYRNIVRLLHIPRMIKLKYFKGRGKQNYT